jgi:hypothetical protein
MSFYKESQRYMKLFLDDTRTPPDSSWTLVRTIEECKSHLEIGEVEELSLDNDLGEGFLEGRELVKWMAENEIWPKNKPKVHSGNIVAALYMRQMIERYFK